MRKKFLMTIAAILVSIAAVSAQTIGNWEKLGERTVYFKTKSDVIRCSLNKSYTKLKINVQNAPVEFDKVIVHYASGASQELPIRNVIEAGGETRVIDLAGNKRIIKDITFYYDAPKNSKYKHGNNGRPSRAVVSVWGRR